MDLKNEFIKNNSAILKWVNEAEKTHSYLMLAHLTKPGGGDQSALSCQGVLSDISRSIYEAMNQDDFLANAVLNAAEVYKETHTPVK